jgi:hypothetical protein
MPECRIHGQVTEIVEHHDQDRHAYSAQSPRRNDRVVTESTVTDERDHRTLRRRRLDPKRRAKPCSEAAKVAGEGRAWPETVKLGQYHRPMCDGLVDHQGIGST